MTTLDEIQKNLTEEDYLVADKKRNLACVFRQQMEIFEPTGEKVPGDARIIKIYKATTSGEYNEIDYESLKEFMKDFFKEKMDVDALTEEVARTTPPGVLIEAHERLQDPEIRKRARAKTGCYAFVIPPLDAAAEGEKGKTMELFLR